MKYYLIGSHGRLGQAIADEYSGSNFVSLNRATYEDWAQPVVPDLVSRFFDKSQHEETTIFVASGLLDPKLPREALFGVNYHLPKNLIEGATKLGIKVITFGTVMESLLQTTNPYIESKSALGDHVNIVASEGKPAIHLQIHTLYGRGDPSPFMFLGQMLSAIRANQSFQMTSGRQLREYHHFSDDAMSIRQIANSDACGVLNLSHGDPVSLRSIAISVFQAFGKRELLSIGSLPEPSVENYGMVMKPTELIQHLVFRDSIPAIVQYLQECYACQEL